MAEVLSPLLQHNDMLQTRPSSSDNFTNSMSGQPHQQQRILHVPRSQYVNSTATSGYRGTSSGPVSPYAFKSTPNLRNETRTISAPGSSSGNSLATGSASGPSHRYPAPASISTSSPSTGSYGQQFFSKDDSILSSNFQIPPFTAQARPLSINGPIGSFSSFETPRKPSPDRYRRGHRRVDSNNSSGLEQSFDSNSPVSAAAKPEMFLPPINFSNGDIEFTAQTNDSTKKLIAASSLDQYPVRSSTAEPAKRYRRRSLGSMDGQNPPTVLAAPAELENFAPSSSSESNKGTSQSGSRPSSASQDARQSSSTQSSPKAGSISAKAEPSSPTNVAVLSNPRRVINPSPLSQPISNSEVPASPTAPVRAIATPAGQSNAQSPAAAAMAALNERDPQKGMKSRLRRAFSFGTAAELRRAAGENTVQERARLRKEQFSNELDDEQDAIAQKQEAAGLGNSIYSGQGNVFTGSTDNLSISSTASSASLMLRKMGKGMKKGGRSLKGLFRPKSVIGVPAADGPLNQASVGQVSMVTVEAEREKVNVNADPHAQAGGGTGYPRLERNSIDQARNSALGRPEASHETTARKGITGGDQERAEILAAVKKGILKRSNTGSPVVSPAPFPTELSVNTTGPVFGAAIERRSSPVPSVTNSEPRRSGHRRTDSINLEGEDYFGALPKPYIQASKSLPGTPRSLARSISFSPRIQFHDAWSSSEYDRRGDIATCNRLTPMLAQQIKEELNTFKMEMEVHELSKPHTHFF